MNLKGWPTSSESIALTWEEPAVINGRVSSYLITYAEVSAFSSSLSPSDAADAASARIPYKFPIFAAMINLLRCCLSLQGDNEENKVNATGTTAYELVGLSPYKDYNIWVQAVNDNGPGASTKEIRVRTFGAAPSSPPNVTSVEAVSSTVS